MSNLMKSLSIAALLALAGPVLAQDAAPADDAAPEAAEAPADTTAPTLDPGESALNDESNIDTGEPVEGDAATPSEGLAMGEEVEQDSGVGRSYTEATFDDWEQRCIRTEDGKDPCQLYQLLRDASGNAVAEMSIFALPEGQQAAAGSTIITPLETLLTGQVTLSVDTAAAKRYPFDFCAAQGCFARIGFTEAEVLAFKRGNAGRMVIVPAAAPDQQIELTISLAGFTAGYEAVKAHNAE